jgi:hypothetical protein
LTTLKIRGCKNLVTLPSEIWSLRNLKEVELSFLPSLETLPTLKFLINQTTIRLENLGLSQLPKDIGELITLLSLEIIGCTNLKTLPAEIGQLNNLASLTISDCESFKELPAEIGQLTNLTSLTISRCFNFSFLSNEIGQLKNLKQLDIPGTSLTAGFQDLWKIKDIKIGNACYYLARLKQSAGDDSFSKKIELIGLERKFGLLQKEWLFTDIGSDDCRLTGYRGEKISPLKLPVYACDIPITRVGKFKCAYSQEIEELIIPEGYTAIDYRAFVYLRFKKISLPNSLTEIGREAFKLCRDLEEIELGEGIEEIKYETFLSCKSLKRIKIPDSVRVIRSRAFEGCQQLAEVELGKGVESIEAKAFARCQNLKEFRIPASLRNIDPYALFSSRILDVTIDDENQSFYVKDHGLYNKKTQELVLKFPVKHQKK